jgi:hypothetical protein
MTTATEPLAAAAALVTLDSIRSFLLAGHAIFTLRSIKTESRKTFKVVQKEGEQFWFVSLLNGSDNIEDYRYLGCVWEKQGTLSFKQNREGWAPEAAQAFAWFLRRVNQKDVSFFDDAEFWHAGRCGKCGRTLTTPESIARGIGPTCNEKEF